MRGNVLVGRRRQEFCVTARIAATSLTVVAVLVGCTTSEAERSPPVTTVQTAGSVPRALRPFLPASAEPRSGSVAADPAGLAGTATTAEVVVRSSVAAGAEEIGQAAERQGFVLVQRVEGLDGTTTVAYRDERDRTLTASLTPDSDGDGNDDDAIVVLTLLEPARNT